MYLKCMYLFIYCLLLFQVQDVNDESPAFESEKYYISVAENTPSGSNVIKGKTTSSLLS